jgi:hypothetical protein
LIAATTPAGAMPCNCIDLRRASRWSSARCRSGPCSGCADRRSTRRRRRRLQYDTASVRKPGRIVLDAEQHASLLCRKAHNGRAECPRRTDRRRNDALAAVPSLCATASERRGRALEGRARVPRFRHG